MAGFAIIFFLTILIRTSTSDFRNVPFDDLLATSKHFADPLVQHYSKFVINNEVNELIVGARDALFRLQLPNLQILEKAVWPADSDKTELCHVKGQSEEDCRNYVNVLLRNGKRLLSCGTYAYSPICTWRELENINVVTDSVSGLARASFSPRANMTALLTAQGRYYAGTQADFSGVDPAILRINLESSEPERAVRTVQRNTKWLNDEAQFAGSFETDKFVYFLFREPAVEYINCGKIVYARIARVCKNDNGGSNLLKNNWTTFLKARLNCSIPGDYPFYYDEIQGMTYHAKDNIVYATFTTPRNSIPGSAICAFDISAIEKTFSGNFKAQRHTGAAWERETSQERAHFQCETPRHPVEAFASSNRLQLMDNAVQPSTFRPLYTADLETLNQIAVEVISTKLHSEVRVLYVATADRLIKKISILPRTQQSCVVGVWATNSSVLTLQILPDLSRIVVGLKDRVMLIPTSQCGRHHTREACARAMDPHCGWNDVLQQCTTAPDGNPLTTHWHQSVTDCPILSGPVDGGWSSWSPYFTCSHLGAAAATAAAEENTDKCKCRTRLCNNPMPRDGGANCSGVSIAVTNCTVHGGWTGWSGWSQCSQTCGIAIKTRYRTCGNPAPAHGGRVCVGFERDEIYCTNNPPCPQHLPPPRDGGWGDWGSWSECSVPCGGGFRMRRRKCDNPTPADAGQDCTGCPIEYETCNIGSCQDVKKLSSWSQWLTVTNSTTRSGYAEKRFKFSCKAPVVDPNQIKISVGKEEERFCYSDGSCTKNARVENEGSWSDWSLWSECNRECEGGTQDATRTCLTGDDCEGPTRMTRSCNTHRCRGEWNCWTDWSPCSVTCGLGVETRTRECRNPGSMDTTGAVCEGSPMDQRPCEMPSCHSLQGWGEWSEWSLCDINDYQHRRRPCLTTNPGPKLCNGESNQKRLCVQGQEHENEIPRVLSASAMQSKGNTDVGIILGCSVAAFIFGSVLALALTYYYQKHRRIRIPGSPHYMTKPNSYVTVPLREPPKRSNSTASSNGSSGYKTSSSTSPTKLFQKPPDYETATIKRNSHTINGHSVRAQLDEDKFF